MGYSYAGADVGVHIDLVELRRTLGTPLLCVDLMLPSSF